MRKQIISEVSLFADEGRSKAAFFHLPTFNQKVFLPTKTSAHRLATLTNDMLETDKLRIRAFYSSPGWVGTRNPKPSP